MLPQRFNLHFSRRIKRLASAFVLVICCSVAFAQSDERQPRPGLRYLKDVTQREGSNLPQAEGSQTAIAEVPYSRVFKDTEEYDLFKDVTPDPYQARFGQGGATVNTAIVSGRFGLPFTGKGFKLDDAEIKLANFYIDLRALSASLLYSDNINRTELNREDGTLFTLRLDFAVYAPLTERFRISVSGALIYLPFENRFGIGLFDPYKRFEFSPLLRSQIAYDLSVGNWEVELIDDFKVSQIPFDVQLSYSYFDGAMEDPQRLGRYSYNTGVSASSGRIYDDRSSFGAFDLGLVQARNDVGARVSRLLPTETRVEVGAFHSDFWYLSGDENLFRLPRSGDWAYTKLVSERENLRFKPFLSYYATHYNYNTSWEHEVNGGIQGPITDYINFFGSVGHKWLDLGRGELKWRLALRHQLTPTTWHSLEYLRDVTEPDRDLEDRWIYRINQLIADGLTAQFYGSVGSFEDLDKTGTGSDEWRAGLRFLYVVSPKTTFQVGTTYRRFDYEKSLAPDSDEWVTFFQGTYKFTPTFEARVQYQFTDRSSNRKNDSFYENYGVVSLVKYF